MIKINPLFFEKFSIEESDSNLYLQALMHRSYTNQKKINNEYNQQERLEFFGDAVLKFITSYYLMNKFPDMKEGKLTKIRARIISDKSLATLALQLGLDEFVYVSESEKATNGHRRSSLLSDTFEAVLGALYLDKGIKYTKKWFSNVIETYMSDLLNIGFIIDHKTFLQESIQKIEKQLPEYQCDKMEGPEHKKKFYYRVTVTYKKSKIIGVGKGDNKKAAQQDAARDCIAKLKGKKLI